MRVRWLSSAALPNWSASIHGLLINRRHLASFRAGLDTGRRPALARMSTQRASICPDSPLRAGER